MAGSPNCPLTQPRDTFVSTLDRVCKASLLSACLLKRFRTPSAASLDQAALDHRTLITLTEYVQKLGGLDRAKQALDTLRELN